MTLTPGAPILGHEPGGMPTYRGHRLTDLLEEPFERVWGLLVDGDLRSTLPPAEPFSLPVRTGDVRADLQAALAHLTPVWSLRPITDSTAEQVRTDLARASVLTLSFVAQAARGPDRPAVPEREVDLAGGITERFLVRWFGQAEPLTTRALNLLWLLVAEQGQVASTRVARLVAGTGADPAACLSAAAAGIAGPLAGGAAVRSLRLLEQAATAGDPAEVVAARLSEPAAGGVPGFAPKPADEETVAADGVARARLMHAACARLEARLLDTAEATEQAMVQALAERGRPVGGGNLMFWAAVLLDHAGIPPRLFSALVVCGRTAGWSAHVLDVQHRLS